MLNINFSVMKSLLAHILLHCIISLVEGSQIKFAGCWLQQILSLLKK